MSDRPTQAVSPAARPRFLRSPGPPEVNGSAMPRDTPENYAAARRLHAQAREYRGRFLNHIAVIERDLALLLTEYFCSSDPATQALFFERVACRMSLEE